MRQKPDYAALNDEKRNALREGRAVWRNTAEQIATMIMKVKDGDMKMEDLLSQSQALIANAREQTKRGRNGA